MAATADQCAALAKDPNWQARVMALAMQYAANLYATEQTNVANHQIRVNFAKQIMNGVGGNIPTVIANGSNVVASTITYDFTDGHVKTDATDAAISSQIDTDWNMLAGV